MGLLDPATVRADYEGIIADAGISVTHKRVNTTPPPISYALDYEATGLPSADAWTPIGWVSPPVPPNEEAIVGGVYELRYWPGVGVPANGYWKKSHGLAASFSCQVRIKWIDLPFPGADYCFIQIGNGVKGVLLCYNKTQVYVAGQPAYNLDMLSLRMLLIAYDSVADVVNIYLEDSDTPILTKAGEAIANTEAWFGYQSWGARVGFGLDYLRVRSGVYTPSTWITSQTPVYDTPPLPITYSVNESIIAIVGPCDRILQFLPVGLYDRDDLRITCSVSIDLQTDDVIIYGSDTYKVTRIQKHAMAGVAVLQQAGLLKLGAQ